MNPSDIYSEIIALCNSKITQPGVNVDTIRRALGMSLASWHNTMLMICTNHQQAAGNKFLIEDTLKKLHQSYNDDLAKWELTHPKELF